MINKRMNVYKITNTVNDKVYIGITSKSLKERFSWHMRDCRKGTRKKLYSAIRKYGEDKFSIELVEKAKADTIVEREEHYIDAYDSYKNGYNASPKSGGIHKHTNKAKKLMSEKATGRKQSKETQKKKSKRMKAWWDGLSEEERKEHAHHANKGRKHTTEFRENCRERRLGTTHSEETKQKMRDSHKGKLSSNLTEDVACPHCGKIGRSNAMLRWHFDRCKER